MFSPTGRVFSWSSVRGSSSSHDWDQRKYLDMSLMKEIIGERGLNPSGGQKLNLRKTQNVISGRFEEISQFRALAYFTYHQSNGPVEAINVRLESLRQITLSFRNILNYHPLWDAQRHACTPLNTKSHITSCSVFIDLIGFTNPRIPNIWIV